jgi:hypothetical protein
VDTALPPEPGSLPQTVLAATSPPTLFASDTSAIPEEKPFRDRSTGLVIFGIAQIILGLLVGLMVPFAALGVFMSRLAAGGASMRLGQFVSSMAIYAFAAATLFCLGIGSVQMRRWAHALTLVVSWYWMFSGALITVLLTAVLPVTVRSLLQAQAPGASEQSTQVSTAVMAMILTIIIVFIALFLVVVPIAFVLFYSMKDVAETCRHRDPKPRWTDHVPLPVLGASVILTGQALYLLLTGVTTPLFPFFGRYLHGVAAFTGFSIVAGLDIYVAIAMFRLSATGWWTAIIIGPIRMFSMALSFGRADIIQAYSKLGWSQEQLRVLSSSPMFRGHLVLWWSLLSTATLYGYFVWLKRYFKSSDRVAGL